MIKPAIAAFLLTVCCCAGFAAAADKPDGKALFQRPCAGCHGADGASRPGGPPVLKGQAAEAVLTKLRGYQAKTYGGPKKAVMENVVKKYSAEELQALSEHVGSL